MPAGHAHGMAEMADMPMPEVKPAPAAPLPAAFQKQLQTVLEAYYAVQAALAADDAAQAQQAAADTQTALDAVKMELLRGDAHIAWMAHAKDLRAALDAAKTAGTDIAKLRVAFEPLSNALIAALQGFGAPGDTPAYVLHCPMAFEGMGADWLQAAQETRTPYFGSTMLKCGSVIGTLEPPGADAHE